ncbi:MAG: hypothetical protein CW338_03750 [Clostridiales bacterium]|nr:hypothetical protein [Clostridiales bacterium]
MRFTVDGVPFEAKSKPDLDFLGLYGKVFCVFDQAVSGNLCFGVDGPYGKLFIKYAGAETVNSTRRITDAVDTLKASVEIYSNIHPSMLRMFSYGQTSSGYATVFEWFDGKPLRPMPLFPDSIRAHVQMLPMIQKLSLLDSVFDLHIFLAEKGYMASDFSDANVLIDPFACTLKVCDLDRYIRYPAANITGRMPGDADFLAPEEFVRDAMITQRSTVYKLGKLAFSFLGTDGKDDISSWTAPQSLYSIAKQACDDLPEKRPPSVADFVELWRQEIGRLYIR